MYPECIPHVSRMYPGCAHGAMYPECILCILHVFLRHVSQIVSYVSQERIPDVSHMYPTCIVLVYPERILRGVCILGCVQGT